MACFDAVVGGMPTRLHTMTKALLPSLCILLLSFCFGSAQAQQISGKVTDVNGRPLPAASVYLKGSTNGTTTNQDGAYRLNLSAGNYTMICAYVGYKTVERFVTVAQSEQQQDFLLEAQPMTLENVDVKAGAEDPAYEIMRQVIARREQHFTETKTYSAEVYMKGLIRSRAIPNRVFGVKVTMNNDIIDSSGKGIIYLSESLTKYYADLPDKSREEVVSAKVSGNSRGFGFNSPADLEFNLYQNNIDFSGVSSRGIVSPVSQNAFHYYRFAYAGSFFEDGKEILKVLVTPKRQYEPLFAGGFLQIIDGEWRIHSLSLMLTKASQIEFVDTLTIQQQYLPVGYAGIRMPQNTRVEAVFGALGFKADADFVAVYNNYDVQTDFDAVFNSRVIKTIDTSANKKTEEYWQTIRPLPLTEEENTDYTKKEKLEEKFRSKPYLDSLDKVRNKFGLGKLLLRGHTVTRRYKRNVYEFPGLLRSVSYNTVEGWVADFAPSFAHNADTGRWSFTPRLRYGFNNTHWNAMASFSKSIGQSYYKRWNLNVSGGKYVFQINPGNPIDPLVNSISTLLYTANYMKIYEKAFGQVIATRRLPNGWRVSAALSYEDRMPLNNTDTTYKWNQFGERRFTSNYPEELPPGNFVRHQALLTTFVVRYQPGVQYIQYPDRRIPVASDKPVFTLDLTKAWAGIAGADADFGRWTFNMRDDINMKLGGELRYNLTAGGFIRNKEVQLPDWIHFNGNQTIAAAPYLESFQLAPYYANSTKDNFFTTAHAEWHLNGLITNKIPLFRKFNWNLVGAANAFFVDADRHYVEFSVGLENIFKIFRVDWVTGYDAVTGNTSSRLVIGAGGIFAQ